MPSALTKVRFHFLKGNFSLPNRSALKRTVESLFKQEKQPLSSLNYIFCSDAYLLSVNQKFLRHNFYTDIISFDLSDPDQPLTAEIYISIDRVRENAGNYSSSLKHELHRVIFHGALHLCGYGDKTAKKAQIMRKMEDKYLQLYFG